VRINLDEQLERLEGRIAEAEGRMRTLRQENQTLRAAHDSSALQGTRDRDGAPDARDGSAPRSGEASSTRPVRQIILEVERQEIRSRLRSLLEAL
jgi:TolA-binding protein